MCSKLHNVTEIPHAGSAEYNNNDDHREKLYSVNFHCWAKKKGENNTLQLYNEHTKGEEKTSRQPTSYRRQTHRLGSVATLAIFSGEDNRKLATGNGSACQVRWNLRAALWPHTDRKGVDTHSTHTHTHGHTRWHMQQNLRVAGTLLLLSSFYEKVFAFLSFSFFCFFSNSWLQAAVKFYWDYLQGTSNGYWYWLIVKNLYSRTFTNTEPCLPHARKYSSEYSCE